MLTVAKMYTAYGTDKIFLKTNTFVSIAYNSYDTQRVFLLSISCSDKTWKKNRK